MTGITAVTYSQCARVSIVSIRDTQRVSAVWICGCVCVCVHPLLAQCVQPVFWALMAHLAPAIPSPFTLCPCACCCAFAIGYSWPTINGLDTGPSLSRFKQRTHRIQRERERGTNWQLKSENWELRRDIDNGNGFLSESFDVTPVSKHCHLSPGRIKSHQNRWLPTSAPVPRIKGPKSKGRGKKAQQQQNLAKVQIHSWMPVNGWWRGDFELWE